MNVANYITSVIRTVVPALWGTAIAWLVGHNIVGSQVAESITNDASIFLVTATIGGYYAFARWLETRTWVPPIVSAMLLGTTTVPAYLTQRAAGLTKQAASGSIRVDRSTADQLATFDEQPARPAATAPSITGSPADERPTDRLRTPGPTTGGEPVVNTDDSGPRHSLRE